MKNFMLFMLSLFFLVSCGGGGSKPLPTVNLVANPTSLPLENTSTLSWTSTNSNSCSALWTSQTSTSGTELVTINNFGNNTYSISCIGDGGSSSASVMIEGYRETDGVVVDGYISGAEVCIDEDDSWTCDASENSTTSDNDGKFTIRYANGNLVSIGGTDLDSQTLLDNLLITHKLTGHSDFKAVTPVTSVAAFMEDDSLINAALGIDASIDVFTFDPVANKGDGGINDYLYEKGNQLTVLAYALQNITNNLNTTTETTQDYFKAITEEIEKKYTETETKVDIETEAFVTKALDNVIATKSVTIDETAKANTTKALASILPVIEIKSSDDLTTGVIRFAVSTLQTDIQAIANGTATAETVSSYTSDVLAYIAEDQDIDADEIAPDISAIADSATTSEDTAVTINVVANDSYLTSAPISVIAGNGTNGITSIAESSPEQITYEPDADYNGTDTFSYTITQGDKTSSADVTVTIEAINDAPSIDIASTIQVAENQTAVTTVSVSDVDEDDLTLTLGGTDADSFNLSDDNILTFKEAPDYETKDSYSITLTLTDGTETVTRDVIVAITNVNDVAPEFTSEATFSAAENQTAIGTVTATDAEGDDVSFTVSGSELEITSAGVLTFVSAPDYETKTSYSATVTASDGTNSTTQDITVNVTNVNDVAPEFTSDATFSAAENQTAIGTVTATDAEGDTITYSISGSEIQISSTGELTFITFPNYEIKSKYTATLIAFDGINRTIQNLTVNIINSDEGIISWNYDISDGDDNTPPIFTTKAIFDSSMKVDDAIVMLRQDNVNAGGIIQIQLIKNSNTNEWNGSLEFPATANENNSFYGTLLYKEGENASNYNDSSSAPGISKWTDLLTASSALKLDIMEGSDGFPERYYGVNNTKILSTFTNTNFDQTSPQFMGYVDSSGNLVSSASDAIAITGNDNDVSTQINVKLTLKYDENILYANDYTYIYTDTGLYTGWRQTDVSVNEDKVTLSITLDPKTAFDGSRDIRFNTNVFDYGLNYHTKRTTIDVGLNSIGDINRPILKSVALSASTNNENRKVINYNYTFDENDNDLIEIGQTFIGPYCNYVYLSTHDYNESSNTQNGIYSGSKVLAKNMPDGIYWPLAGSLSITDKQFNNADLREAITAYSIDPIKFGSSDDYCPQFIDTYSTIRVDENTTDPVVSFKDNVKDPYGNIINPSFSISGPDANAFSISDDGVLNFKKSPDYENPEDIRERNEYHIHVRAHASSSNDNQSRFISDSIRVRINDVDETPPVFTSTSSFSVEEGKTLIGYVVASDENTLSYSISGDDALEISIDSNSGALSFNLIPDYEFKSSYSIIAIASDGIYETRQNITINILDINYNFNNCFFNDVCIFD